VRGRLVIAAIVVGFVAACAPPPPPVKEAPPRVPEGFPADYYQRALDERKPVFRVDPSQSLATIEVRRGGSLARLGHDHVVASHDVQGYIAPEARRADLYVELDRLMVDEPDLRKEAGFDTEPSAADIAGTRQNMLDKVLEVERYPYALISIKNIDHAADGTRLNAVITLHGTTRAIAIRAKVDATADAIEVSGRFALLQSEFGMSPFSILGGAIQVADQVDVRFRVRGRRVGGADA
jgi:hypothetical protein